MIAELLSAWITAAITAAGYAGIFLLMAGESAALPIPSEVVLPFSGFLAFQGVFDFWTIVAVATVGQLAGALLAYYIGMRGGRPLVLKYTTFDHGHLDAAERWFARWGPTAVLTSRFLPIIRTFISLPAGMARMDIRKFSLYTFFGSLPWTAVLTYVGVWLGPNWNDIIVFFDGLDVLIVAAIALYIAYIIYKRRRR